MTLSSAINRMDYTGNDSTATYSFSYRIFADSDLVVTVVKTSDASETTLVLDTDYSVTGAGAASGSITLIDTGQDFMSASSYLDTGYTLVIRRVRPITQTTDIRNQGDFYPETHEDVFDKLTMVDQQQQEELDRTVKFSEGSTSSNINFPEPSATKIIGWNDAGTALENKDNESAITMPASSTDNTLPRFDGTTGKALQTSSIVVDDSDNVTIPGTLTVTGGQDMVDNVTAIVDNGDATKKIKFDASGITTATTRTVTVPDADLTMAGTATTQTLTNKTIDGDNNTISNLAHGAEVDNPSSGVHGVTGSVVGTTDTQTLTNKTVDDDLTLKQIATPSAPASGYNQIYFKSDGNLYKQDSGGTEQQVGGSGSGGGSGYPLITGDDKNFDASVGSWTVYADAAATSPVDMTGGSPTLTATRTTSTPHVSDGSLLITKDAADRQGEGFVLQSIAIPVGYRNQPLKFRLIGEGSANYADGDMVLYAYDETNAQLLGTIQNVDSGALPKALTIVEGIVYPGTDCASIRVGGHVATTNASAWTYKIDQVELSWEPLINLPFERVETVALDNSFTGGNLRVARSGNVVTITCIDEATHASATSISSSSGLLPEWARPDATTGNVYYDDGTLIYRCNVTSAGLFQTIRSTSGTSTGAPSISFSVATDANTVEALAINNGLLFEEKILSADVTTNTTMSDLTVSNLVSGRRYKASGQFLLDGTGGADAIFVQIVHNGSDVGWVGGNVDSGEADYYSFSYEFTAAATSVTFVSNSIGASNSIRGNGGKDESFIQIQEVPFSQTALVSGTRKLGTETWTDNQANATTSVRVYRSGPMVKVRGEMSFTGAASGSIQITVPSAYSIVSEDQANRLGTALLLDAGTATYYGFVASTGTANTLQINGDKVDATYGEGITLSATVPHTWASGDLIRFTAEWEVEGWS